MFLLIIIIKHLPMKTAPINFFKFMRLGVAQWVLISYSIKMLCPIGGKRDRPKFCVYQIFLLTIFLLFFSTINAENKGYNNSVIICAFVKTYGWSLFYYNHNINIGNDLMLISLTFYNMWGLITWQRSKKRCNARFNFVFLSI